MPQNREIMRVEKAIKIRIWLLILISATLMSIPYLIPHCGFTSLFAFVPLFYLDKLLTEYKVKRGLLYYFSLFLLFNIATTFWIYFVSAIGSIFALLLNALQMSAIFAIFRWSRRRSKGILPYIFFIATWISWEKIYCDIEISWPWLQLGNSFAKSIELAQWYELTGILGGTFWILFTNLILFLLLEAIQRKEKRAIISNSIIYAVFIIVPITYSIIRFNTYEEVSNPKEVVVVQPNVDPFNGKYGGISQLKLDHNLIDLSKKVLTPETDFIVTPETFTYSVDVDNATNSSSVKRYLELLEEYPNASILFGALTYKRFYQAQRPTYTARKGTGFWYDTYNSAFLLDSEGNYSYSHKSKLVPGVEIIPYQQYIPFLGELVSKFGGAASSYARMPGGMSVMEAKDGTKICAPICYESIYSDYVRECVKKGTNLIFVITNDGWWGDTPGYRQHFDYARLRAIETRRSVIHCANTGISAVIDQRGVAHHKTKYWVEESFNAIANSNDKLTPFTIYGDIVGRVSYFVFILLLVSQLVVKRRSEV